MTLLTRLLSSHQLAARATEATRMPDIADRVRRVIVRQLGVPAEEVTPSASFRDDLGADSLDVLELTMEIEEEFGIQIGDEAAGQVQTVGQAISLVQSLLGQR